MSLILFVFYWVGVPLLITVVARSIWRQSKTPIHKGLVAAVSAMVFLGLLWFAEGEKWLLDQQVRELCAKDGGVRVYEKVRLPAKKFDELKRANFVLPDKSRTASSSDEYYSETDQHYYRKGNPEVSRRQYRVIRRSDQKILGELVFYGRGGGDLPGPWYGSSFTCPDPTRVHFESEIFVKGNEQ